MPALLFSSRWSAAGLALLLFTAQLTGCTGGRTALFEGEVKPEWKEAALELPPLPVEKDLIPFQVSPGASAASYVDGRSLRLDSDGIVRFTLLVRAAGGAENLSYEGIRCETAERKLYAMGRAGSEWVLPRNAEWQRISDNSLNRQYAVLAKEFFCLPGSVLPTRDEILGALRNAASLR
ncbi:MAG: CNP1-like family protein [Zoogloea sp.]|uniref:CNP1-like family protein n=1 Tax=Zoogloea sp. TaxID=49181 RepID=UPI00262B67FA|nr:CNP1-like family protein [Zoogloea sp.]MDD2991584.1 CNP1-like family protein [Zoogloea sp.]